MTSQNPLNQIDLPVAAGDRKQLGNLATPALGWSLAQIAQSENRPILLIAPDQTHLEKLRAEIRFFVGDQIPVHLFPDWETLPYDTFSPHQEIISRRARLLFQLPQQTQGVLLISANTLMMPMPPASHLHAHTLVIQSGDIIDINQWRSRLEQAGYLCVSQVTEPGEFAVRGSLFDLWPSGSPSPYRVDLLDDEVESIRQFDPENQRSTEVLQKIELLPAREFALDEKCIQFFRKNWRSRFPDHTKSFIYQDVSKGIAPSGIEYYLPLFHENIANIFDYLPKNTLAINLPQIDQALDHFQSEIVSRYENYNVDYDRPLLRPDELFLSSDKCFSELNLYPRLELFTESIGNRGRKKDIQLDGLPELQIDAKADNPFVLLQSLIDRSKLPIIFTAESAGRREALLDLLHSHKIHPHGCNNWQEAIESDQPLNIVVAPCEYGFSIPSPTKQPAFILISESDLLGERVSQQRKKAAKQDPDLAIRNLAELREGAAVVHIDHGIGRYIGLQILQSGGLEAEYLVLEYAKGDKIYVPVAAMEKISRYSGHDQDTVSLNKLGSDKWNKAKRKAAEKIRDVAAELLDVYAQRAAKPGFAFDLPDEHYQTFAASFPFEETDDQKLAIGAVIGDMTENTAMDRLICGDVGFGKTEVAIRAAFLAIQGGKQVAILVPTTLLAQQHYENIRDRFADWPIRVEVVSRFTTGAKQKSLLGDLSEGKVDLIIGTHRLLSNEVKFRELGLVVIDEEHRFGVRQKEKLRSLRAEIDILTMTATPIPRTLNMSMAGMRDLSIITTPPARRLAIKTFVREKNMGLIREAVLREILRGGQVYYVYNQVDSIERCTEELAELIPEARVAFAHGQMSEQQMEKVMTDFHHQRCNLLVCTTIIETGIDIPNANTMVIDRADKFGLAQLHQLRGRVGRSYHQAYAYLLTPHQSAISADAQKRLLAIESFQDLGAGFALASQDLEIRGAGELLGEGQSGQIASIGFTLYMEMLDQAVSQLKAGKQPELNTPLNAGSEVDLRIPALIPDDYLPDVQARLVLYKRIASCKNAESLRALQVEMIDRFGLLPAQAKNLFKVTSLKQRAELAGIARIDVPKDSIRVEFTDQPNAEPGRLFEMLQKKPREYQLDGPNRIRMPSADENADQRLERVFRFFDLLERK